MHGSLLDVFEAAVQRALTTVTRDTDAGLRKQQRGLEKAAEEVWVQVQLAAKGVAALQKAVRRARAAPRPAPRPAPSRSWAHIAPPAERALTATTRHRQRPDPMMPSRRPPTSALTTLAARCAAAWRTRRC